MNAARTISGVLCMLISVPSLAWAGPQVAPAEVNSAPRDDARYRSLIEQAINEFRLSNYPEALTLFQQAYQLRPSARALRGVAKARFEHHQYARAIDTINAALANETDPLDESLRGELIALRDKAQSFVGKIHLDVTPPSAQVTIDGVEIARAERDGLMLDQGPHAIEVRCAGYRSEQRTVEVVAGSDERVAVALGDARPVPVFVHRTTVVHESRAPAYVAAGVGVAAIAGAVGSALWFDDRRRAVDACTAAAQNGADCTDGASIATEKDAATWALAGSLGALVVSSVATIVLLRGSHRAPTTARSLTQFSGTRFGVVW